MNYKILYVDDDLDNLIVFKSNFKNLYSIVTAISADEALTKLTENEVQVVISDQRMPKMNGVEFLEIVRERYPAIIRIILTGYSDSEAIIDAINRSAIFYFMRKPWNSDELRALIDKSLSYYNLKLRNQELVKRLFSVVNELETFYYRISHDLKGPVATQLGLLKLVRSDKEQAQFDHYLDLMEDSMKKLERTIKKIESLKDAVATTGIDEVVDFHGVLNDVVGLLNEEIVTRGIHVSINIGENVEYRGNTELIRTLFESLLENSIHFSDSGKSQPHIHVMITASEKLVLEISDNGIGIDENKVDNIFDAFYRGSEISKGNGLGLYLVKKTIEGLHGAINVHSTPGVGTQMVIQLPFV